MYSVYIMLHNNNGAHARTIGSAAATTIVEPISAKINRSHSYNNKSVVFFFLNKNLLSANASFNTAYDRALGSGTACLALRVGIVA